MPRKRRKAFRILTGRIDDKRGWEFLRHPESTRSGSNRVSRTIAPAAPRRDPRPGAIADPSPRTRRRAAIAAALAAGSFLLPGCSGRPAFLTGGPTVGQLKTSVAHLEYENAQMKRDVARLRRENHQMEDRLVQQEQDNGELTARLDDARNLLRDRGLDPETRSAARPDDSRGASDSGDGFRAVPAGQSNRKRRKPPVARIPGQITPASPERGPALDTDEEPGVLGPPQDGQGSGESADAVGLRFGDDLDHHSGYSGPLRWAPIAGRSSDPTLQVR